METKFSATGSIIAKANVAGRDVHRTAAHTYKIDASEKGKTYGGYVVSIKPAVYRCQCDFFLYTGKCKHGEVYVKFEALVMKRWPKAYKQEKQHQKVNQAKAQPRAL